MARWDDPTFFGSMTGNLERFNDLQVADRSHWIAHDGDPGFALSTITVVPRGASQEHKVNIVDPASVGWLEPPGDFGAVHPAGR